MLAIFDARVAKLPEYMRKPHKKAVSSMTDAFLVNYFTSLYPDSVIITAPMCFIAYSLGTTKSHLPRFRLAHKDNLFCMYQGVIKDFDSFKCGFDFDNHELDSEAILIIQAFKILRLLGQRAPTKPVEDASGKYVCAANLKSVIEEDVSGNSISVIYETNSKVVILAGGTYHDLPTYWGVDARFNLVVSSDKSVVQKACVCFLQFLSGHIYACFNGQTVQEAVFINKQSEIKPQLDSPDKRIPISHTVESVTAMILQADRDRSSTSIDHWLPPMPKVFKINTAAVILKNGKLGVGILVRNSKGDVIMAVSRRKVNEMLGSCVEVQALMQGVYLAVEFSYGRCEFESGYLNVDKNMGKPGSDRLESRITYIGDQAVKYFSEFGISFVSDDANTAARGLAKYATFNEPTIWHNEVPECIANIIKAERPDAGDNRGPRHVSGMLGFGTNFTINGERSDVPGQCNICHKMIVGKLESIVEHQLGVHKQDAEKHLVPCTKCGRLFINKVQVVEHKKHGRC